MNNYSTTMLIAYCADFDIDFFFQFFFFKMRAMTTFLRDNQYIKAKRVMWKSGGD